MSTTYFRKISQKAIGRKYSPEVVEKRAEKIRGIKRSPEQVAHLFGNKHAAGSQHTEEWKAANLARNIGVKRPKSQDHRRKIAESLRGRKASAEHRANQIAAQLGVKRGPYKRKAASPDE